MATNIAIIGLGKQNTKDHLQAALRNPKVKVTAICDSDKKLVKKWEGELKVPGFTNVERMLEATSLDAAIVAVPHFAYLPILTTLMNADVHILKEKPFAMNLDEAKQLMSLARTNKVNLMIAVQRKHNKVFQEFLEYAPRIGDLFSIHGEYTLNIPRLDEGWRASRNQAGGGAVIDMGYHLIDLITWYFGLPERISADLGYYNRQGQDYDVEDTAKIQFSYERGERRVLGSLILSRIYPEKDEGLFIYGTKGAIKIFKNKIELFDDNRELVESKYIRPDGSDVSLQFDSFIDAIQCGDIIGNAREHLLNMIFIDAIYRSDSESITVLPKADGSYADLLSEGRYKEAVLKK